MKRMEFWFSTVAAIALFVMMWLTVVDVVGRKFFEHSLFGAVELTEIFMTLTIFFALPLASLASEHIVFDLLDRALPAAVLRYQKALSQLLTGLIMGGASWVVAGRAARTAEYGDITAQIGIVLWPFHYLIALMLGIAAVIHLVLFVRELRVRQVGDLA